jgi:hypothetical protein
MARQERVTPFINSEPAARERLRIVFALFEIVQPAMIP